MTSHEVAVDFSGSWILWEGKKGLSCIWVVWSPANTGQLGPTTLPGQLYLKTKLMQDILKHF